MIKRMIRRVLFCSACVLSVFISCDCDEDDDDHHHHDSDVRYSLLWQDEQQKGDEVLFSDNLTAFEFTRESTVEK